MSLLIYTTLCSPFHTESHDGQDGGAGDRLLDDTLEVTEGVAQDPGVLVPHQVELTRHGQHQRRHVRHGQVQQVHVGRGLHVLVLDDNYDGGHIADKPNDKEDRVDHQQGQQRVGRHEGAPHVDANEFCLSFILFGKVGL